jgi:hypothetical protein
MNYSVLALFILSLSISGLVLLDSERRDIFESTDIQTKAGQFLNYVYAFDAYRQTNAGANGDVTNSVPLPAWLPQNANIKMYVSGGVGFVYTPTSKGVYTEVLKESGNSSAVGITDNSNINTVSGTVAKPNFINSGYIVYVR